MNPFPGLRPFREGEAKFFFGREKQVGTMLGKLARSHFLSVVGTSGSGKSSLVNCGLRPALDRGELPGVGKVWSKVQFRPGNDPIGALARALAQEGVLPEREYPFPPAELIESTLRMSRLGLIDIFRQARFPPAASLLIVCDQFEELFRFRGVSTPAGRTCDVTEDDRAFVNLLLEVRARTDLPIYVTITMRSDFLGEAAQFAGLPETIDSGQYLVPRMTRDERRAAVEGPIRAAGATISPVLLTRLVNDVGDNPDQLSILQHALNRTWAEWENKSTENDGAENDGATGEIQLRHYEKIGTMARALNDHAEEAYRELTNVKQQECCEKMFKALTDKSTSVNGVRRPTTAETLLRLTGATMRELEDVMEVFRNPSRSFLMPPEHESLTPKTVVDISHESLMRVWNRLRDWSDAEAQDATSYRRLVWSAELYSKNKANLWRGRDLAGARLLRKMATRDWAERYAPGYDNAMDFVDKSERRQRIIQSAIGGAVAVVVLGSVRLMAERDNERRLERQQTQVSDLRATFDLAQKAATEPAVKGVPRPVVQADLAARFDALEAITTISVDASAPPLDERSKITIEYSPKPNESTDLRVALEKLGFTLAPDTSEGGKSPRPPNCLWYDDQLAPESVKLIAYAVIGAGYGLVGIQPRGELTGKSRVRINHIYHLQAESPLTTAAIHDAAALPVLRRKPAKAYDDIIGSITEISEDGLRGAVILDDGRGPVRFVRQSNAKPLAVGDKVTLTAFFPDKGPPYGEWVTPVPPPEQPATDTAPIATSTNEKGP